MDFLLVLPPITQINIENPSVHMSKVTVVGSGNVGATVANVLAHQNVVNEIILLDLMADMAKGKALDTW